MTPVRAAAVATAIASACMLPPRLAIVGAQSSAPAAKGLTAVTGLKVGHHTLTERPTGCTVVVGPGTPNHYRLSQRDIEDLVAFFIALTDPRMHEIGELQPETLPSGLPADVAGARRFPLYGAP